MDTDETNKPVENYFDFNNNKLTTEKFRGSIKRKVMRKKKAVEKLKQINVSKRKQKTKINENVYRNTFFFKVRLPVQAPWISAFS